MHCMDAGSWAQDEFGGAKLGDVRRSKRLVAIAHGAASAVGTALSNTCGKSGAQAVSRLLGRDEATYASVSQPHIDRTRERMAGQGRILAIQDTTVLDFTTHKSVDGIGPVTTAPRSRGLLMHSVLAVNEGMVPLGLLGMQLWARDESCRGCAKDRRKRSVGQKESSKWIIGLHQAQQSTPVDQPVLVIGDRESDVYALFSETRREGVELLVRLAHNRSVIDDVHKYALDALGQAPIAGIYEIDVPRQGNRPKRRAKMEVRYTQVKLARPCNGRVDGLEDSVEVSLIWAVERDSQAAGNSLDWTLLTTEVVDSYESAVAMIRCYSARWVIEEFHRVLKSGCKVEQMQFDTADRLKPAIAILAVVAWRILYLTKYARSKPDLDACEVASVEEITVLRQWLRSKGESLAEIRTVRDFCIAVARLGGFLGRLSDGMPGTKTTWQGLRSLEILVLGYRLATQLEIR